MTTLAVSACRACGSVDLRKHCDGRDNRGTSPTCDMWVCRRCCSIGDKTRFYDARNQRR